MSELALSEFVSKHRFCRTVATNGSPASKGVTAREKHRELDRVSLGEGLARPHRAFCQTCHPAYRPRDLKKIFEKFGEIRDVYTPIDFYTKRPRGFAFIEFVGALVSVANQAGSPTYAFPMQTSAMRMMQKLNWMGRPLMEGV